MRSLVLAAALLVACNNQPPEKRVPGAITGEGDVVFTINGTIPVHQNMYDAVMNRIPPEQRARMETTPGGMDRIEEQLAMSQLLYDRAIQAGVGDSAEAKVGLAMSERDYLAAMYVQAEGEKAVSDEAISKRYEERKVQYARPQVKARHILVKEESEAMALKAQLDGGADFAKLAEEQSLDPGSKTKGGELGWFEQRRMDPAFGEAAFAAEKNQIVGPVKSRFGYHLIEVLDKREAVPLDEVKEEIAGSLRQEAIQNLLQGLQGELKITRPGEPEGGAPEAAGGVPAPGKDGKALKPIAPRQGGAPGEIKPPPLPLPAPAPKDDGHDGHDH